MDKTSFLFLPFSYLGSIWHTQKTHRADVHEALDDPVYQRSPCQLEPFSLNSGGIVAQTQVALINGGSIRGPDR